MKIRLIDSNNNSIDEDVIINKSDILVFKYNGVLTAERGMQISQNIKNAIKNEKILILDKTVSLKILSVEDELSFLGKLDKEYKGADNGTLTGED